MGHINNVDCVSGGRDHLGLDGCLACGWSSDIVLWKMLTLYIYCSRQRRGPHPLQLNWQLLLQLLPNMGQQLQLLPNTNQPTTQRLFLYKTPTLAVAPYKLVMTILERVAHRIGVEG